MWISRWCACPARGLSQWESRLCSLEAPQTPAFFHLQRRVSRPSRQTLASPRGCTGDWLTPRLGPTSFERRLMRWARAEHKRAAHVIGGREPLSWDWRVALAAAAGLHRRASGLKAEA